MRSIHDFVQAVDELYPEVEIDKMNPVELREFTKKEDLCPKDYSCDRFIAQLLSYFKGSSSMKDVRDMPPWERLIHPK